MKLLACIRFCTTKQPRASLLTRKGLKRLSLLLCLLFNIPLLAIAESPAKEFPSSLPAPPLDSIATDTNTPEYVIIRSSDEATFSSEMVAEILKIPLKEGSRFNKGDLLLEFDCRLQQADLKKAEALHNQAKTALASAAKLKSYGSISEFEVSKAQSEAQTTEADVDKLKALVDKCTIEAPFNGTVANVIAHAHETVRPGDPLLKIINTDNLEFEIQVPSPWLSWLHVGTTVLVHLNETSKTVTAKITKINPEIEPISQSVKVIATITPADPGLLAGMSGQADFPDNPSNPHPEATIQPIDKKPMSKQ